MLQYIDSEAFVDAATILVDADPETARLVLALTGCCHPKANRLLNRLAQHPDPQALLLLRAEVFQLLTLTFGKGEAMCRLQ